MNRFRVRHIVTTALSVGMFACAASPAPQGPSPSDDAEATTSSDGDGASEATNQASQYGEGTANLGGASGPSNNVTRLIRFDVRAIYEASEATTDALGVSYWISGTNHLGSVLQGRDADNNVIGHILMLVSPATDDSSGPTTILKWRAKEGAGTITTQNGTASQIKVPQALLATEGAWFQYAYADLETYLGNAKVGFDCPNLDLDLAMQVAACSSMVMGMVARNPAAIPAAMTCAIAMVRYQRDYEACYGPIPPQGEPDIDIRPESQGAEGNGGGDPFAGIYTTETTASNLDIGTVTVEDVEYQGEPFSPCWSGGCG